MKRILQLGLIWLLFLSIKVYAQEKTISGKITSSEDGSGLPGVTISVKGTTVGTVSDNEGKYTIAVPATAQTLSFSFIGMATQEVEIGARSVIDVNLVADIKQLSEVVVTANAIEREKRSLGYSVTTFNNQDVTQGKDRSILNSLQGKVSGVLIQSASGSVGSSTRVVIRGGTSITGNNQALFVVDGIPIDNSSYGTGDNLSNQVDAGNRANDINPSDVESVTILKGPAAAALYGSRASNGAIIITTKTGKGVKQKAEVTYSSSYTFETILKLPEFQNEYGQGGEKVSDLRENFSWGPKFDGKMRPWGRIIDGESRIKPYSALPDNVKEFFDVGKTFTNNLSLAGGNDKSNYYLSIGNLDQKGVVPLTEYGRTSIKVTGGTKFSHNISSQASLNYIRTASDLSVQGQSEQSFYNQIIQTPRDISLLEQKDLNNKFNDVEGYYSPYITNPWAQLRNNFYKNNVDRILGNVQLNYKPLSWIDITYRIGTDFYTDRRRQGQAKTTITGPNKDRAYIGKYVESNYFVRELTSDLMISGKKNLTEDLSLSVLVGQQVRNSNSTSQASTANGLVIPGLYNLDNASGTPTTTNDYSLRRLWGVYTDINLSYKNYLFLGLTGRNDWSSTLPRSKNNFFYPSVNAGFVFSDALNIKNNLFSYGKLRVSFAQVGNDPGPYSWYTYFNKAASTDGYTDSQIQFPINNVPAFSLGNSIGNPKIKPEITQEIELGAQLNFFNDRIRIDATVYDRSSFNQIISVATAPSSGYTSKLINAGKLSNKGIELLLGFTPIRVPGGFSWDISLNFTRNRNKVEALFGDTKQISLGGLGATAIVAEIGHPYGSFFTTDYERDPQGRVVVSATTGYPIIDPVTRIHGNIQPNYFAGLVNTFSFKGLSLNVVFDTKQGGKIYSRTKDTQQFVGTSPNTLYNDREPFVFPNSVIKNDDGTYIENTTIKVANAQNFWTNQTSSASTIIDATYVKLRELSLTYSFPKSLINKTPFGNLQVGISGRNLLIWTPKENTFIDPETNSFGNGNNQGFEFSSIPSTKSIGGNIKLTF